MKFILNLFSGEMGRWDFFTRLLATTIGFLIVFAFFIAFFPGIIDERTSLWLSIFISTFYFLSISFRRLHDLGKSELLVILYLIPGINVLFLLYLLFFKGKPQK